MSKLQQQINSDLKQAMKGKETNRISVLRMLISSIRNKEIALRKGKEAILTEAQIVEILRSEVKKRKDSITAYEQGNRQDLAQKEKNEIEIIEKYLPKQMSDEDIEKAVKEIVQTYDDASVQDFGKIMGQVMSRLKGKADGSKISEAVKRVLAK